MTDAPRRRYEVAIRIGADEVKGIVEALHSLEFMYASEGMGHDAAHGGPDWGFTCVDSEDPNQTHEAYFAHVERWIAERRAEKADKDST